MSLLYQEITTPSCSPRTLKNSERQCPSLSLCCSELHCNRNLLHTLTITRSAVELIDLLSPVSVDTFLSTYWARSPLHVPATSRQKLAELPGLASFPGLLAGDLTEKQWSA